MVVSMETEHDFEHNTLGQPEEISCFRYPDRPTFFQKRQKKKKRGGGGGGGGGGAWFSDG